MTDWTDRAACYLLPNAGDIFFPDLDDGDNHGAEAKHICAQCPVARQCLEAALDRGEDHGIWGGAGGDLMRWLRRMWLRGGTTWDTAVAQHVAQLRGETSAVVNRNGPGATHGLRVTYNRGCRCPKCEWATSLDGLRKKNRTSTQEVA
jgi:WhiB family transcriptional regulator, redox-sensing transcriptional regulator